MKELEGLSERSRRTVHWIRRIKQRIQDLEAKVNAISIANMSRHLDAEGDWSDVPSAGIGRKTVGRYRQYWDEKAGFVRQKISSKENEKLCKELTDCRSRCADLTKKLAKRDAKISEQTHLIAAQRRLIAEKIAQLNKFTVTWIEDIMPQKPVDLD